jgi:CBS domain-containing protein
MVRDKEPNMRVQDLMARPVSVCRAHESLAAAAKELWEQDCGAIPVVTDDGSLLGIITDRDICMAAYTRGLPLADLPIHTAMAKEVFSCGPQDDLATVEELMRSKRIRRVPVVDRENRPIGMVSFADLARAALHDDAERKGLRHGDVLRTIAEISEPRVPVTA